MNTKIKGTANQNINVSLAFQGAKFTHRKWWHRFIPKYRRNIKFLNEKFAPVIDEMFLRGELK